MKKLLLLASAAVLFIAIAACTKHQIASSKEKAACLNPAAAITGKWELRQMIAQVGTVNFASGNGNVVEFKDTTYSTTNPDFSIFVRGNHPNSGSYHIVPDTSVVQSVGLNIPVGQFRYRIILNSDTTSDKIFYQADDDKLIIISGYFPLDGGVQLTYQKQ